MRDETTPTTIAATVTQHGTRIRAKRDVLDAAVALDEECAQLRERLAKVTAERDAARAKLNACPVGPAKEAPDEAWWWLITAPGWNPTAYHIGPHNARGPHISGAWFKVKVQP